MKQLPKSFFKKDAVTVAQQLLGKVIKFNGCSGMVVETEAYQSDQASHAFNRTARSAIMYDSYAHWYVYFIYGMYYCLNVTTNFDGPGAVLIRAVEPLEGIDFMKRRRKTADVRNICSGPGKLCQAFKIGKDLNGTAVGDMMGIYSYRKIDEMEIAKTSRVGINKGKELDWRFYLKGNGFVSK
jgi:DNA-3-methyladenine glycosylase